MLVHGLLLWHGNRLMSSVDLHVIQENRSWCRGKGGKIKERGKKSWFILLFLLIKTFSLCCIWSVLKNRQQNFINIGIVNCCTLSDVCYGHCYQNNLCSTCNRWYLGNLCKYFWGVFKKRHCQQKTLGFFWLWILDRFLIGTYLFIFLQVNQEKMLWCDFGSVVVFI